MFARIITFTGARNIDAGISFLREDAVPVLRDQKGYRGLSANADRSRGLLGVMTIWDTKDERDASWTALAGTRQQGLDAVGGGMSSDNYELVLQELGADPPVPGSALLLIPASLDPARADEHLAYFRANVLPEIKQTPGFQAVRMVLDRDSGNTITGTTWSGPEGLRAAATAAEARRQPAAGRGVRFGEASYREVVVSDIR